MHFPSDAEKASAAKKGTKKGSTDPRLRRPADMPPRFAELLQERKGLGISPKPQQKAVSIETFETNFAHTKKKFLV